MGNIILNETGKRLKSMMKDHDIPSAPILSEEMFGCDIDKTRSINKHLKGETEMGILRLDEYCAFFGCSADYMLGYIEEETPALTDVHEATGLSVASIKTLEMLNKEYPKRICALDFLLSSSTFQSLFLHLIGLYYKNASRLCHAEEDHRDPHADKQPLYSQRDYLENKVDQQEYQLVKLLGRIIDELKEAAEKDRLPELRAD